MQNKEYDCPNSEPTIRNRTHPDIRKTAIWSHYLPKDTCLFPLRPEARTPAPLQIQEPQECLSSLP